MNAIVENTGKVVDFVPAGAKTLVECEQRIETISRAAFYEVGKMLRHIRDTRMYKDGYGTFEEYCDKRWEWNRDTADRMIAASCLVDQMQSLPTIVGKIPSKESHVRPLFKLVPSDEEKKARTGEWLPVVVETWNAVVTQADTRREPITAKLVTSEVDRKLKELERSYVPLHEWAEMSDDKKESILAKIWEPDNRKTMNRQDNASIEWAQWSWNPITGCKHDCPYCYARDIAHRFYPQQFEPSLILDKFMAPGNTSVPEKADDDISFRNVFTGSMADIFGRWVPEEWIEAVFRAVLENPQWNFLFLTKFPKRMVDFKPPQNAWLGTTVDCQVRVKAAEDAFENVQSGTRWLSIEPMLEPLKFTRLHLFDWIVIGGASSSQKTPGWVPPMDWIVDLHQQAREAGCKIYYKENLGLGDGLRLKEFPWTEAIPRALPDAFKYLKGM